MSDQKTITTEEKLAHIEKCLDWSTVEKYNDAIVALAYIEEIRREKAFWKLGKITIISEVPIEA